MPRRVFAPQRWPGQAGPNCQGIPFLRLKFAKVKVPPFMKCYNISLLVWPPEVGYCVYNFIIIFLRGDCLRRTRCVRRSLTLAQKGGMESGYDPDGLSIKGPRVPRTLRTLKLHLLLHLQNTHPSILISLVLFLSLALNLFMLIPFFLNNGLILSICIPKASGLTGNIKCV